MPIEVNVELKQANEMLQAQKDSYDYDPYMHGMYNGMELIISTMEDREPVFLSAPKKWTSEMESSDKE